jgi:hypothetical protein
MPHLEAGLLHELVDGEVPSTELDPIQAHLLECAECRARLEEARQMAGESDTLIDLIQVSNGEPAKSPGEPSRRRSSRRLATGQWVRPLALAASMVLAVALGYAGGASRRLPVEMNQPQAVTPPVAIAPETVFVAAETPATRARAVALSEEKESGARSKVERRRDGPAEGAVSTLERRVAETDADRKAREGFLDTVTTGKKLAANERQEAASDQLRKQAKTAPTSPLPQAPVRLEERSRLAAQALKDEAAAAPAANAAAVPIPISFVQAAALLDGRVRQIEGMAPIRLEAAGLVVRVIYLLDRGELVLQQQRDGDSVVVRLTGPLTSDSLAKLQARVR